MAERAQIVVKGIVQGVGFRPYIFNLAESLELKGYVTNTSEGVLIDIEGGQLPEFVSRLQRNAPPLSQITDVSIMTLPFHGYSEFSIEASIDRTCHLPFTLISPDVSVCDDCLRELLDPRDRRYLYPFLNCTNCGPRYSITTTVPYDRVNTTMAGFSMCPECMKEYRDSRDRRFHAQPNACPRCGPEAEFKVQSSKFKIREENNPVQSAIHILKAGGIVAVKGLGGFHIACDASNEEAVQRLRSRKRKSNKPFAVMTSSFEIANKFCRISKAEQEMLQSIRRPIVLLKKRSEDALAVAVSPNNQYVGVMLPYTPLHYLLFRHPLDCEKNIDTISQHFTALVMTSGNLSEEPIIRDNDDAMRKLSGLVDGFLFHNRDIFMRVDDSVVRLRNADCGMQSVSLNLSASQSEISFLRRSRGYAPDPIELHEEGPEVLACGADVKNTFTLTKGKFAIPSQHIGDMENYETVQFFEESLENMKQVYRVDPVAIVHDLHPGYLSTRWAIECGVRSAPDGSIRGQAASGVKTYGIQHHYAHIGSVMAEHGLKHKVIGVAFDGTGYGTDGNLWGGEFLIADIEGFERAGNFNYIALPGGEAAIREPWKTAVSCVMNATGEDAWDFLERIGFTRKYGKDTLDKIVTITGSRELSPLSSGAGRLFDSVSALLCVCDTNTFEGEAAMALESLVERGIDEEYPVEYREQNGYTIIQFEPTIAALITDITKSVHKKLISTKFHNTIASVIRTMVKTVKKRHGLSDVALSGGTFQNQYLLEKTLKMLSSDGMNVFINEKVPCNDAGISLGQAYLVRERLRNENQCSHKAVTGKKGSNYETNAR